MEAQEEMMKEKRKKEEMRNEKRETRNEKELISLRGDCLPKARFAVARKRLAMTSIIFFISPILN